MKTVDFITNLSDVIAFEKIENHLVSEIEFETLKYSIRKDAIVLKPKTSGDILLEKKKQPLFNFFNLTINFKKKDENTKISLSSDTFKNVAITSVVLLSCFIIGLFPIYYFSNAFVLKIYLGIFVFFNLFFIFKLYKTYKLQKKVENKLKDLISNYSLN